MAERERQPMETDASATIDGDPISARYVAGRIADGGGDVALSREALDEIAKAGTGAMIRASTPGVTWAVSR